MHSLATLDKRATCGSCLRPQNTCICQWIRSVDNLVDVLILQHPMEVHNAKGSARLLNMSLSSSHMISGEVFSETSLQALLDEKNHPILLYPDAAHGPMQELCRPPELTPACLQDLTQLRLIVLDGTWRKSRKMLYQNPLLQRLPRLALRDQPASHYLIRKAHRPDQLSTLEASCMALMQLEGCAQKFQPLLTAFDGFVAQQLGYRLKQRQLLS